MYFASVTVKIISLQYIYSRQILECWYYNKLWLAGHIMTSTKPYKWPIFVSAFLLETENVHKDQNLEILAKLFET